jgi:hypothetical protein
MAIGVVVRCIMASSGLYGMTWKKAGANLIPFYNAPQMALLFMPGTGAGRDCPDL